eukprot:m.31035 g.31035  ORF g.31035 m.31035 type:complete len:475 (+) comp13936_c0_seq1:376-1800(+)
MSAGKATDVDRQYKTDLSSGNESDSLNEDDPSSPRPTRRQQLLSRSTQVALHRVPLGTVSQPHPHTSDSTQATTFSTQHPSNIPVADIASSSDNVLPAMPSRKRRTSTRSRVSETSAVQKRNAIGVEPAQTATEGSSSKRRRGQAQASVANATAGASNSTAASAATTHATAESPSKNVIKIRVRPPHRLPKLTLDVPLSYCDYNCPTRARNGLKCDHWYQTQVVEHDSRMNRSKLHFVGFGSKDDRWVNCNNADENVIRPTQFITSKQTAKLKEDQGVLVMVDDMDYFAIVRNVDSQGPGNKVFVEYPLWPDEGRQAVDVHSVYLTTSSIGQRITSIAAKMHDFLQARGLTDVKRVFKYNVGDKVRVLPRSAKDQFSILSDDDASEDDGTRKLLETFLKTSFVPNGFRGIVEARAVRQPNPHNPYEESADAPMQIMYLIQTRDQRNAGEYMYFPEDRIAPATTARTNAPPPVNA